MMSKVIPGAIPPNWGKVYDELLKAAKEHYWDSLEPQKELIIKHLEGVVEYLKTEPAKKKIGWLGDIGGVGTDPDTV